MQKILIKNFKFLKISNFFNINIYYKGYLKILNIQTWKRKNVYK